jgi:hypothetical protein
VTRQTAFLLLALVGWASGARAASRDTAEAGAAKKVGLISVETRGVPPQLTKRLRGTVLEALRTEGVQAEDLIETYGFLAECRSMAECLTATLRKHNLDYVLLAKLTPSTGSSPGKPEHEIAVRLGRMPRGASVWGPWPITTNCQDCSDTELADATRQLVSRALKAMRRAELPPQETEVSAQDRRGKAAKLLKQAADEQLPVFDQIYLLKKAIHAGAGGQAFLQLAQLFFASGSYEEAEDYAGKAAAKGEKADVFIGPTLWFTGRWAEALPVFQKLVHDFPNDDHWQKALDELEKRIRDGRGPLGQAEAELKRGDPAKAAQLARIALAAGRGTKAHLILGKASLEASSNADAIAQFISVLDAEPSNADALAGKQKAEEALRKARELRSRR